MADQVGGAKGAYIIFLKYSSHLIFLQVLAASKWGVCYQQSVVVRFFFVVARNHLIFLQQTASEPETSEEC